MLERERLESKKISKTNAVTSMIDYEIGDDNVHVGPSDYVPWLQDRKWCHIRMEGTTYGNVPLNMELKLDRQLANRRIFPAVDVNNSSTRREEILLSGEELKIMWKLRRVLAALDQQQAVELLIDRLKKTKSNVEFLMQVQQTSNIKLDDEDN